MTQLIVNETMYMWQRVIGYFNIDYELLYLNLECCEKKVRCDCDHLNENIHSLHWYKNDLRGRLNVLRVITYLFCKLRCCSCLFGCTIWNRSFLINVILKTIHVYGRPQRRTGFLSRRLGMGIREAILVWMSPKRLKKVCTICPSISHILFLFFYII